MKRILFTALVLVGFFILFLPFSVNQVFEEVLDGSCNSYIYSQNYYEILIKSFSNAFSNLFDILLNLIIPIALIFEVLFVFIRRYNGIIIISLLLSFLTAIAYFNNTGTVAIGICVFFLQQLLILILAIIFNKRFLFRRNTVN